jgi:protein TonB
MTSKLLQGNAINKAQPPYPQIAKLAGADGPVQVQIMISEDGRVVTAEVLSGHSLLREAARQAALQWRFRPTVLNGVPVPVTGIITFDFKLNR